MSAPTNPFRRFTHHALTAAIESDRLEIADALIYLDDLRAGRINRLEQLPAVPWIDPENAIEFLSGRLGLAEEEQERRNRIRNHPIAASTFVDRRAELDEIKQRIDLTAFIERHAGVQFRRVRSRHWCSCPLPGHPDSEPSFAVSEEKQLWVCYGCQRGGDVLSFVEIFNDLPFRDAVDLVAREAGVLRPAFTAKRTPVTRERTVRVG